MADHAAMDDRNYQFIGMCCHNVRQAPGYPLPQYFDGFRARNHIPALFLLHLQEYWIILMRLDPKQSTFPIAEMNFSQIGFYPMGDTQVFAKWRCRFDGPPQTRGIYSADG